MKNSTLCRCTRSSLVFWMLSWLVPGSCPDRWTQFAEIQMTALSPGLYAIYNHLHMANGFNNQTSLFTVIMQQWLCPNENMSCLWAPAPITDADLNPRSSVLLCHIQRRQTVIKPNSWMGRERCTKWHKVLEYLNEIKLKWGTIIKREDLHQRQDLCLLLQVYFFFSWIEYQLISWVICCSGNWLKGWEQTAHIQASHRGTEDNKRAHFYSCFSLFWLLQN